FPLDLAAHDPERRLALLDRDEIDVAVLSLQPSLGIDALARAEREELELAWVEGIRSLIAESGGRFRAFAPWRVADGFSGTSVGTSALLDPEAAPDLLAEVDAAAGVLFVHPEAQDSVPAGRPEWWNWTAGYTAQMQRAYLAWLADGRDRLPSIRIVFAILAGGAPVQHERLVHRGVDVRSALDPNTLFDTASYGRRAIELCIETFGVERLVYGSDTPVIDTQPTLDAVRGLGDSVLQILQADTPRRLFA
ncbi:MAG: amidohydrolase, partial [Thermoleophilia bacterium]|nr:amidohydrolase [Thermoleophilia bacterium]